MSSWSPVRQARQCAAPSHIARRRVPRPRRSSGTAAGVWDVILWRNRLLQHRNRQLEQAVRQRTAELESERTKVLKEKMRADAASEAKGQFLANMSQIGRAS